MISSYFLFQPQASVVREVLAKILLKVYKIKIMTMYGNILARSFMPEQLLVAQRDIGALAIKYDVASPMAKGFSRARMLLRPWDLLRDSDQATSELDVMFGAIRLVCGQALQVDACTVDGQELYCTDTDNINIHFGKYTQGAKTGIQRVRQDLASAADYVATHEEFLEKERVVGVTYSELARIALRLGFRPGIVLGSSESNPYIEKLKNVHRAVCAVNGVEREFDPALVYMPTETFVATFQQPDSSSMVAQAAQ